MISPQPKGAMKLKEMMKNLGVTQKELADKAGVSISMVSHVVAGRKGSEKVMSAFWQIVHERKLEAHGTL